jgi:Galactosyltransferase
VSQVQLAAFVHARRQTMRMSWVQIFSIGMWSREGRFVGSSSLVRKRRSAVTASFLALAAVVCTAAIASWRYAVDIHLRAINSQHIGALSRELPPLITKPVSHVFVVVKTMPEYFRRRRIMRATWLPMLASGNVTYRFFSEEPAEELHATIELEVAVHHDMVLLENLEVKTHRQLGVKMIESFRWVDKHWDAQFVIVADDDTYVHAPTLHRDVPTWNGPMFYLGYMMNDQPVIHIPPGATTRTKYGERGYPSGTYPRYASGIFFALSIDAIQPFIHPQLPLRSMSSNDAQAGTVLMPYNMSFHTRPGILPWGHKNKSTCIMPEAFYCLHATPEYSKSWEEYEEMMLGLHRNLSAGRCIYGFQIIQ